MSQRPPFEIAQVAMVLLAVLIIDGVLMSLILTVRCVFWFIEACNREWGIRDWINEIIIVLVALIGRAPDRKD